MHVCLDLVLSILTKVLVFILLSRLISLRILLRLRPVGVWLLLGSPGVVVGSRQRLVIILIISEVAVPFLLLLSVSNCHMRVNGYLVHV
jgi:hypothetical protein